MAVPDITLFYLSGSRAIRIAWLLEELDVPYKLNIYPRDEAGVPDPKLKIESGTTLGKSPVLHDGKLVIEESGAIAEYLIETYDLQGKLLPRDPVARSSVRSWIHAAEGTFMVHGIAVFLPRYLLSPDQDLSAIEANVKGKAIVGDLQWLEETLARSDGDYIVGNSVTAADTMMLFSAVWMFDREMAELQDYPRITRWIAACEGRAAYQTAVEKTGHRMPKGSGREGA